MTDLAKTAANALGLLEDLVAKAVAAGATAADAVLVDGASLAVTHRLGKLEKLERSEGGDIGLRVLIGGRQAIVSSADRRPDALAALVERAVAMARTVPEDPFAGLAEPGQLARDLPAIDNFDPTEPSAEALTELVRALEDEARSVPGVTNSEGAEASWGLSTVALVGSNGFSHAYHASHSGMSVSVVAGTNETGMEGDYDYSTAVYFADLRDPLEVGREAGRRATRRLGAKRLATGRLPVVFDPRVSRGLVGHLLGAINGGGIARGTSFLKDRLGEAVFAPGIRIIEDPHRPRGLRSKPCDAEGLANRRRTLVEDGRLTSWILDLRSARQLGLESTGHASRGTGSAPSPSTTNVWLEAGPLSPQDLMADIEDGLYVTDLVGQGVNGLTGDYSRGAAGFRIEKGVLTTPVNEITIAGNLIEMFAGLTPANDLDLRYGTDAPTVRLAAMTIAGG
ncbi:TldD/PmbA family protein [Rhodospirillum rubrum]|uniref:Peptidase U62, modulator of DNA gyrase n=1 Tax=Rhodospirillum rubrum (strain ATCC 11170 / ATH 1.1.1 / DSM 467 / LMG 4362 / NCIMB 8255 / S1) TaxID=269796 RepID=Q2RWW6_RHORT|nr:TldD/PmbA family protein [Rhodospirillum rubrum]ABC21379.1 microcin-processing peptidase 1. Unknown type peptidase. MEROPS family U62 [Rhodospirillum rubrum ATCC 11170]AEO47059.1 microcin-processing peptidase 1 [Rhodospirillum rubrum F11]MBK5952972.1 modulator protein [Rhodospirillum rubrum]QXG81057.1 TldD/PmbA family protein [Rhodospirillum rubrum]HAQ00154.1 TldD/PmbA family protein [Rhodospirillum rubrum]